MKHLVYYKFCDMYGTKEKNIAPFETSEFKKKVLFVFLNLRFFLVFRKVFSGSQPHLYEQKHQRNF